MGEGVGSSHRPGRRVANEGADIMRGISTASVTAYMPAASCEPAFIVTHSDGTHSVRLTSDDDASSVHVNGTLDELAAFVLALAGVVRELDANERATTEKRGVASTMFPGVGGLRVQR